MAEVAAPVVRELRLALLAPAELSALEEQNQREPLIPVRTRGTKLRSAQQRGGKARGWGWGGSAQGLPGEGVLQDCRDRPSPAGGADRRGVEMPRSAKRGCGPGRPVPPPEGNPAPGASLLSGPAL